jgi:tRNA(fMet)-specific endonuclease VapC
VELSVGPHVAHDDDDRSARQQHLQQAEADFEILRFDAALIAASAIADGVAPYTCNPDDFQGIPRLELRPVAL